MIVLGNPAQIGVGADRYTLHCPQFRWTVVGLLCTSQEVDGIEPSKPQQQHQHQQYALILY